MSTSETPFEPISPRRLVPLALLFEGGLALAAWLLGRVFDAPPASSLRWNAEEAWAGVAATLPMLAAFVAVICWPVGPLARIKQVSDELIRPLFARCSVAELALVSAAAGFGEELLFRGLLQTVLEDRFGWVAGLCLASVVFGLLHFITASYAVYAALMGGYLGGVWLFSGNLLVVMVAHALYDFLALVYLVRRRPATTPREAW